MVLVNRVPEGKVAITSAINFLRTLDGSSTGLMCSSGLGRVSLLRQGR